LRLLRRSQIDPYPLDAFTGTAAMTLYLALLADATFPPESIVDVWV
jgi:hypothetical protein